ncbi:MAG: MarR family transcriptional regulator [Clostridia bacterium]|nr:MarR family transcriptional regulator [Clostridia bacterium]
MKDKKLPEQLLRAWVKLTGMVKNSRITKGLAYNEAIVMLLLYNRYQEDGVGMISMKEIAEETKMLKSLVNRTINTLEEKGLLERCTSQDDKRVIFVRCIKEKLDTFLSVHNSSLALSQKMIDIIGEEDAEAFVRITQKIENANLKI